MLAAALYAHLRARKALSPAASSAAAHCSIHSPCHEAPLPAPILQKRTCCHHLPGDCAQPARAGLLPPTRQRQHQRRQHQHLHADHVGITVLH
jgi:hypothetical protein